MLNTRTLTEAARYIYSDPNRTLEILGECSSKATGASKLLVQAKAVLIKVQAGLRLNQVSAALQVELQDAAMTLAANRRFDDWCHAMTLLSSVAFSLGDTMTDIAASVQGFREARATSSNRLLAARSALWALSHQPGALGDKFVAEVRQLATVAESSHGQIVAKSHLAWHDFRRILIDAGIPTDTHPHPSGTPTLTLDAAKKAAQVLIADLEILLPELRAMMAKVPAPMLFLAIMKGFVSGSDAARDLAVEVVLECGRFAEASVHSALGVVHHRNGEFDRAVRHLEHAIESYGNEGRPDIAAGWHFYLAQAYSALGRYKEAYDAISRFHAGRYSLFNPVVFHQMLERVCTELRLVEVDIGDPEPRPRHTQSVPPYLKKTLQWMAENLHNKVTPLDIVAVSGVSRRTLESAFRIYCETSLMEELKTMRLRRARLLLREDGTSVAAAMRQVAYTSAPTFSRDFRKHFGVSPRSI